MRVVKNSRLTFSANTAKEKPGNSKTDFAFGVSCCQVVTAEYCMKQESIYDSV